ncbi:MAG: hypothetical protein CMP61_08580 [Flavobacteriales bacterium]|nr:hypothetical protein [Flavobacteriales bacterium]|tara:strand:- start:4780 stop:6360 length:1581 start_codon:yes stop_codon:yes gene_type:complete
MRIICLLIVSFLLFSKTLKAQDNTLNFDGVNDFLNVNSLASVLAQNDNFTIEFWMQADIEIQNGIRTTLFAVNKPGSGDNEFLIVLGETFTSGDEKLNIYDQYNPVHSFVLQSPNDITGDCHHIAYVKNGNIGEAFVDGVSIGTHQIYYNITKNHRVSFGQDYDGYSTSDFYKGNLDDIMIWNVAKTSEEILIDSKRELTGSETNLIAYYNFNQGTPSSNNIDQEYIADLTGNHNATMSNFNLNGYQSNLVTTRCAKDNYCSEPDFKFTITVTDAIGNEDQIVIGFGEEASTEIDQEFCEEDLIYNSWDEILDVRCSNFYEYDYFSGPFVPSFLTKRQIINFSNCLSAEGDKISDPIAIDIHAQNWPITISWDGNLFNSSCFSQSSLSLTNVFDHSIPLFNASNSIQSFVINEEDGFDYSLNGTDVKASLFVHFADENVITNTQKIESITDLIAFPNPALDHVSFSSESLINSTEITASFFDSKGSLVKRTTVNLNEPVNIELLQSGIYTVYLKSGNYSGVVKVVK